MRKSIIVLLHIGFWACYIALVFIVVGVYYRSGGYESDRETRIVNALENIFLFAFLPSFISYYLYYLVLFPRYLQQRKIFLSIVMGLLMTLGTAIVVYILHRYLIEAGYVIDMDEGGRKGRSTVVFVLIVMTIIGVITGAAALVLKGFITWFNEIKLKEMLKEKNFEMEMALIKSQLDPHLLFNTINNIDALILKDPAEASAYLNRLSDIMRFVLYETKGDQIPLSKEIEYIEKYIALQKIRTSNESYVNFAVTGEVRGRSVAPMVFIPFIENAFKHTNNKKLKDAIRICINVRDNDIQLICENKFDSKSIKQPTGGLGNELAKKRLDLIYGEKHTLNVRKDDELYTVDLTISK